MCAKEYRQLTGGNRSKYVGLAEGAYAVRMYSWLWRDLVAEDVLSHLLAAGTRKLSAYIYPLGKHSPASLTPHTPEWYICTYLHNIGALMYDEGPLPGNQSRPKFRVDTHRVNLSTYVELHAALFSSADSVLKPDWLHIDHLVGDERINNWLFNFSEELAYELDGATCLYNGKPGLEGAVANDAYDWVYAEGCGMPYVDPNGDWGRDEAFIRAIHYG